MDGRMDETGARGDVKRRVGRAIGGGESQEWNDGKEEQMGQMRHSRYSRVSSSRCSSQLLQLQL